MPIVKIDDVEFDIDSLYIADLDKRIKRAFKRSNDVRSARKEDAEVSANKDKWKQEQQAEYERVTKIENAPKRKVVNIMRRG